MGVMLWARSWLGNTSMSVRPVTESCTLAEELRRPWEKPTAADRLTPARVRRGFRNIRAHLACPTRVPKPTGTGPDGHPAPRTNPGHPATTSAGPSNAASLMLRLVQGYRCSASPGRSGRTPLEGDARARTQTYGRACSLLLGEVGLTLCGVLRPFGCGGIGQPPGPSAISASRSCASGRPMCSGGWLRAQLMSHGCT